MKTTTQKMRKLIGFELTYYDRLCTMSVENNDQKNADYYCAKRFLCEDLLNDIRNMEYRYEYHVSLLDTLCDVHANMVEQLERLISILPTFNDGKIERYTMLFDHYAKDIEALHDIEDVITDLECEIEVLED